MIALFKKQGIHQMDTAELQELKFSTISETTPKMEEGGSLSAELERLAKKCKRMEERMKAMETAEENAPNSIRNKKLYSSAEVAALAGVCRNAMYYLQKRGKIPSVRVGRSFMYEAQIIDAMVANGSLKKYGR